MLGVLRIHAAFDGVTAEPDGGLLVAEPFSGGDPYLFPDQIDPGDQLGDRMLDLDSGVHLDEVEASAPLDEELHRARRHVIDRVRDQQCRLTQPSPRLR
jgi:hypothetical protein